MITDTGSSQKVTQPEKKQRGRKKNALDAFKEKFRKPKHTFSLGEKDTIEKKKPGRPRKIDVFKKEDEVVKEIKQASETVKEDFEKKNKIKQNDKEIKKEVIPPVVEATVKKRGRPKKIVNPEITSTVSVGTRDSKGDMSIEQPVNKTTHLPAEEIFLDTHVETQMMLGMTKSLGNFEFARVNVSIKQYCERGKENEALAKSEKICSEYIAKLIGSAEKNIFARRAREEDAVADETLNPFGD